MKNKPPNRKRLQIGVVLPDEVEKAITDMAAQEKRTLSNMLRVLIEEALEVRNGGGK